MKKKQAQITFGFCDVNTGQRVYPATTDLPDKLPPAQQLYTSDDNMYAAITCSPPIGQPTIISKDQDTVHIPLTSILSSNTEYPPDPIFCLVRNVCCIIRYISSTPCPYSSTLKYTTQSRNKMSESQSGTTTKDSMIGLNYLFRRLVTSMMS
jgi:hypothetical protein